MNNLEEYQEELKNKFFLSSKEERERIIKELKLVRVILELEAKGMKFDNYV